MSDNVVEVGFKANPRALVAAAKAGDKALEGLGDEAANAGKKTKVLGKETQETARDLDGMSREARDSSREIDGLARRADRAAASTHALGKASRSAAAIGKGLSWGGDKMLNQYTAFAGGLGAAAAVVQTAKLDKSLTNIRLTAGATSKDANQLRQDLFRMSGETGAGLESLAGGFNNLVQAGESWGAARQEIDAINVAMAVSEASAEQLSGGLSVASKAFKFDLSKPGLALSLLDKMTVAGRQGSAELENLSSIFARVGVGSSAAGFSFDQTLGFVEALSAQEMNPERLATLADSTIRLFNNMNYLKNASKATGVKFFDPAGNRRDVQQIFADLRVQYRKLKTDEQRAKWMQKAFGQADLDTQRGIRIMLDGTSLEKMAENVKAISGSSGALKKDLSASTNNLLDQASRFKTKMREAGEEFSKPVADFLTREIKWVLGSKAEGGSGLSGQQVLLGGAAALGGAALLSKFGGGLAAKLGGGATGLAMGKTLEATAGVTPVFVVNMPGSGLSNPAGSVAQQVSNIGVLPQTGILSTSSRGAQIGRRMAPGVGVAAVGAIASFADNGNTARGWGGALGAAAGTALGSFGGPIGMMIGAQIGATAGPEIGEFLKGVYDEYAPKARPVLGGRIEQDGDYVAGGKKARDRFTMAAVSDATQHMQRVAADSNPASGRRGSDSFLKNISLNVETHVASDGTAKTHVSGEGSKDISVSTGFFKTASESLGSLTAPWALGN